MNVSEAHDPVRSTSRPSPIPSARAWALGLSLPLGTLFSLLADPDLFGVAFGGGGAAVFVCLFLGAIAVSCAGCALARRAAGVELALKAERAVSLLLPCGLGSAAVLFALRGSTPIAVLSALAVLAGAGMGVTLICWLRAYASAVESGRTLQCAAESCLLCAIPALLACAIGSWSDVTAWWLLALLSVGAAASTPHATGGVQGNADDGISASETLRESESTRPFEAKTAATKLWQPLVGLALSLFSMALPWGAYLEEAGTSVPPLWSFAIGWMVPAVVLGLIFRNQTVEARRFDLVVDIGIPILAAMVVALWMMGDVEEIAPWTAAVKGVVSGTAGAFLFSLAWTRLAQVARTGGESSTVSAVSLGLVFLVAALIIPIHAVLGRNVAGTISPVASLAFLVAVCIDSTVRLARNAAGASAAVGESEQASASGSRRVPASSSPQESQRGGQAATREPEAGQEANAIVSQESAVSSVAEEFGFSRREREVLVELLGGRSVEGIAATLGISPHTVRTHVQRIHAKLQVSSRNEIVELVESRRAG